MTESPRPFDWLRRLNPFASGSGDSPAASTPGEAGVTAGAPAPSAQAAPAGAPAPLIPTTTAHTEVVFLPRDPQWAYCFWSIAPADLERARAAGAGSLCLRVADVTGLLNPQGQPHALQELVVDAHASEWFLPVPLAGRDYRVELGFRLPGGGWFSLAFSTVARIPELEPSATIADAFVPFSLESPLTLTPQSAPAGGVQHERLYQMATMASARLRRVGSETLHEQDFALDSSFSDSGAGVWASGRSDSGSGLVRSRSFWLVADAELIVYGATEPTATLTIGDQLVPLNEDGGFRVHVPFPDGGQTYPIRAIADDGEQERSITLDFERNTPEAHVNTPEQAVQEWF